MTIVKICGLKDATAAIATAEAGADYIGLVFAPSRRQVTPEQARQITSALRKLEKRPLVVGVFANQPVKDVNEIAAAAQLDIIQLSGVESPAYCRHINLPVIKVIHVSSEGQAGDIIKKIRHYRRQLKEPTFMLDTVSGSALGGTGQTFNWQIAAEVSAQVPILVAGGLNPANVSQLIKEVSPWGIDVSSGVEKDGQKDIGLLRQFIQNARETEEGKSEE